LRCRTLSATVAAMQFLSRTEYARMKGVSRQSVEQRIKRGTLKTVRMKVETEEERIPVEDAEVSSWKALTDGKADK
jgi:hypothetical protein